MAESAQIQKVSIKHEMIMNYIMENPQIPLGEVAYHFGISQAWLSTVIHSPAFQDRLLEKKEVIFHHTVVATVRDKVSMIAHRALDKMAEQLEFVSDPKELRETADMALERLGYGGKANGSAGDGGSSFVQNNTILVTRDMYLEAQDRVGRRTLQGSAESLDGVVDSAPALPGPKVEKALGSGGVPVSVELLQFDGDEA